MKKYIDPNKIKFNCDTLRDENNEIYVRLSDVKQAIEQTPAEDVVEVERCKDCKHKTVTKDGEYDPDDIVCGYHMSDGFNETDFCSYGTKL